MKRIGLLISVFVVTVLLAGPFHTLKVSAQGSDTPPPPPAPANGWFVQDMLHWFTPAQLDEANAIAKKLKDDGVAEVGIATVADCGQDHKQYRNVTYRSWGIGDKKLNIGILIEVCWQNGDKTRSLEQETGYGAEGTLPDLLTAKVAQQFFVPAFKGKDANQVIQSGAAADALIAMVKYYDGLFRNEASLKAEIAGAQAPTPAAAPAQQTGSDDAIIVFLNIHIFGLPIWLWLLIILAVLVVLVIIGGANGGSDGDGGFFSGSSGGSWGSSSGGSSGSSFGGFSGGSSGGSSGGGGFSGGSSGGGGSSTGF